MYLRRPLYGRESSKKGFTIVELLVVIVVLGILASIGTVSWNAVRTTTMKTQVQAELALVRSKFEKYKSQNSTYPTALPSDYNPAPDITVTYAQGGTATRYCVNAVATSMPTVKYHMNSLVEKATIKEGECTAINTPGVPVLAEINSTYPGIFYQEDWPSIYITLAPPTSGTAASYKIYYKNSGGAWTLTTPNSNALHTDGSGKRQFDFWNSNSLVVSYETNYNATPSGAVRIIAVGADGTESPPLDVLYSAIDRL